MTSQTVRNSVVIMGAAMLLASVSMQVAFAAPVPGGTLDPTTVPKYLTPLVIPPEMPTSTVQPGTPAAKYNIAVRQFKQQILPAGFNPTTVWSYGRAEDVIPQNFVAPTPLSNNISFNYPAFTVENTSGALTSVRWINDLIDPVSKNFLPHLFAVDQTLHWANPPNANCNMPPANRTDCHTDLIAPYTGPVPLITHVHGAHVNPQSDGYPEAWFLPAANNIPAGYAKRGSKFDQFNIANAVPGSAFFSYENSQSAATLWYHDHALGMTRLNVYAGPAGFWLIRGGANGDANVNDFTTGLAAKLPGPAPRVGGGDPNFDAAVRAKIREIPIVIQDRSFNLDGSLFYPTDRTFFDGFTGPFIGNTGFTGPGFVGPSVPGVTPLGPSDISPIWNPEAFFNTMVVNGSTWPQLEVAPALYRFRLLDGCNSRTLNLSLQVISSSNPALVGTEVPFYQIGAEQGFLPQVVKIQTGIATPLPGTGILPPDVAASNLQKALLMGPAERADVIVAFSGLPNGTVVRMINTAPDFPFNGTFDPLNAADPGTSGQVMQFVVNNTLTQPSDASSTPPQNLVLPAIATLGPASNTRQVSLNEMDSAQVCVTIDAVTALVTSTLFSTFPGDPNFLANCTAVGGVPMGPRQALLGVITTANGTTVSMPKMWSEAITENPLLNSTEVWEIYNTTVDAHPIHVHLVAFQVIDRQNFDPLTFAPVPGTTTSPNANETGYKDTVIALPGQITRIKAKFDIAGEYVWHCHIVEHEDNEMMRPYAVRFDPACPDLNGDKKVDNADLSILLAKIRSLRPADKPAYDLNGDGKLDLLDARFLSGKLGAICP